MIVDPDFLDHWRTQMLVTALGEDALAPIYVLRIWAHCQARKATCFANMPAPGLAALCRFKGDPAKFEAELIAAGFITRDGADINVPKWAEHNKKLIANWDNGATGGRPQKIQEEPKRNPNETQTKPTETHAEPIRDREDLDKNKSKEKPKAEARGSRLPSDWTAPAEFIDFCKTERPDLDPSFMENKFRDFWCARPGKDGRKTDWFATWRNFIRAEFAPRNRGSPTTTSSIDKHREIAEALTGRSHGNQQSIIDIN